MAIKWRNINRQGVGGFTLFLIGIASMLIGFMVNAHFIVTGAIVLGAWCAISIGFSLIVGVVFSWGKDWDECEIKEHKE